MNTDRSNATKNNRHDAQVIVDLIKGVEVRCMAADGPVTPTEDEISKDELKRLLGQSWRLARRILR